jgi:hypothetical protein
MTYSEIISSAIALLALVISLVVWHGQRKLQREANELQRATSELSRRQLQSIEKEEAERNVARLDLTLERQGQGHIFTLTNFGPAIAHEVELVPLLEPGEPSPLIDSELSAKFPAARLLPGTRIGLLAVVFLERTSNVRVKIKWRDGTGAKEETASIAT